MNMLQKLVSSKTVQELAIIEYQKVRKRFLICKKKIMKLFTDECEQKLGYVNKTTTEQRQISRDRSECLFNKGKSVYFNETLNLI